ncbi:MAG: DUF1573 domain-containing protein [Candidatus Dojkabacteria bacterium]
MNVQGVKKLLAAIVLINVLVIVAILVLTGVLINVNNQVGELSSQVNKLVQVGSDNAATNEGHRAAVGKLPSAETHKSEFDFGVITEENGKVSTTFEIENHGKGLLEIGTISTSCACTSAEVNKTSLGFNEVAILTVVFDPNVHAEPKDRFSRKVYVETNDPEMSEMEFTIFVDIKDN